MRLDAIRKGWPLILCAKMLLICRQVVHKKARWWAGLSWFLGFGAYTAAA